jgi:uncharacterized membrane protein
VIGLVIRVLVLCAAVFAVVYALTRALRLRAQNHELGKIADRVERVAEEIAALRLAVERAECSPERYAKAADDIREECRRLGLEPPDLPASLGPRAPKE